MVNQGGIDGFRANQMIQDKELRKENGSVLFKRRDAGLGHLVSSLWASIEVVICYVAPLGKGLPLPARRALQLTASQLAERINTTLIDHLTPRSPRGL